SELARAKHVADESDPDWTWDRLNAARKRPPAGKNSAELMPRIKKDTPQGWGKQLYAEDWAPRVSDVPPNVRFAPDVLAEARRELTAAAEAVKLARTLKDFPFGHREYTLTANVLDTMYEETQWTRNAVALLSWDTSVAADEGDAH